MTLSFSEPIHFALLCALFGLIVGSFLNVLILRLPKMMEQSWRRECSEIMGQPRPSETTISLSNPASHCPHCDAKIRPWHNIPLLSWLLLRGHCADCGATISIRYPLVELISGVLSALIGWQFGFGAEAFSALLLVWSLIALTVIDLDTQLLPDSLTLPLLWLGLTVNIFETWAPLSSAVTGAIIGYGCLWCIYWLFKLATGKEGMGYGDFKLLAALGAWFGWQAIPLMLLLSSLVGALSGIVVLIVLRKGRDTPLPFGPYLAGAGLVMLFYGDTLITEYLRVVVP